MLEHDHVAERRSRSDLVHRLVDLVETERPTHQAVELELAVVVAGDEGRDVTGDHRRAHLRAEDALVASCERSRIEGACDAGSRHPDDHDRAHRADQRLGTRERRRCAGRHEDVVGHQAIGQLEHQCGKIVPRGGSRECVAPRWIARSSF